MINIGTLILSPFAVVGGGYAVPRAAGERLTVL